jgi:hypothetical protein
MIALTLIGLLISIILWKFNELKNGKNDLYTLLNFLIPLFILSIYPWKTPRYALFIFPFAVIYSSSLIEQFVFQNGIDESTSLRLSNFFKIKIEYIRNIKFATLFMVIMLLFAQLATAVEASNISSMDHGSIWGGIVHSNWKKGAGFIKINLQEEDKIITTLPVATLYYLGKADYFLRQFEYKGMLINGSQLVDSRAGARILNSYDTFLETINNERGWVVVDHTLDLYFTDPRVRDYIRSNMIFHPEGSDNTIEVYSWNR